MIPFLIIAAIPVMKSQLCGGILALNTHISLKHKPDCGEISPRLLEHVPNYAALHTRN
jgi:hypothetical protein